MQGDEVCVAGKGEVEVGMGDMEVGLAEDWVEVGNVGWAR